MLNAFGLPGLAVASGLRGGGGRGAVSGGSYGQDIKSLVVSQLVRQLVHTMFITNNLASFHLWLKENLVKYQYGCS